jgi:hypothetical protein
VAKKYTEREILFDPKLFISHLILEEAGESMALVRHFKENMKDGKIEVKVVVAGYEVTCDSFQAAFEALWKRGEANEKKCSDDLALSFLSDKAKHLVEQMEEIQDKIDYCDGLLTEGENDE